MKFEILGGNQNADISIEQIQKGDIVYAMVKMTLPAPEIPEPFQVCWKHESIDCYAIWSPAIRQGRKIGVSWSKRRTDSRFASWMPLHLLVSAGGQNRLAIAVSDTMNPIAIKTGICEEDGCFECEVEFFTIPTTQITEYSAVIRLDIRNVEYSDSIYDAVAWWENECGYSQAYVPECAKLPINSLWYSYHQVLNKERIVEECRLSKKLGMETVIIDAGWQTDDNSKSYAFCGDWEVAYGKMGDMKELVDRIHAEGMKVILWYSIPYIGIHSKKYEEYKDMILEQTGDNCTFFALDPRYKKVRDYLVQTYTEAVKNWGLDGLKLDFIDAFCLKGKSIELDPRRDYNSLEQSLDVLLTEVTSKLKALNPEILIEFRQSYIGPSIRKYCNMLRVADCPNDVLSNRVDIVNLRLTSGKTAVHSDMIMWSDNDTVESAALQFASILYSVPQISMRIGDLREEHYEMLQYYMSFWLNWKDVLLDGKLTAKNQEIGYSIVRCGKDDKAVFTVYINTTVEMDTREAVVVNATGAEALVVKNAAGKNYHIVSCKGEKISAGVVDSDLKEFAVPRAGMLFLS